ncbi:MAG: phospholipid-binding protein MlaC [Sandaracinaceae bacterium]
MTRHLALLSLLLGVGCAASLAAASPARAQSAVRFLEQRHERLNTILRQPASSARAQERRTGQIRDVLGDLLDYEAVSRTALGDHWDEHSDQERQEFMTILEQLVRRNYERNLERTLEYEVRYDREEQDGELTVVHTVARSRTQRRQPPVEIVYTLRREGRAWKVVDVATDGVSMVRTYRRQFHRIIVRDGWSELISRMQRRLAADDDDDG